MLASPIRLSSGRAGTRLTRAQGPAQGRSRAASSLTLEEGTLGVCQEQRDLRSLEVLSEPHGIHWGVESHKPPASLRSASEQMPWIEGPKTQLLPGTCRP